MNYKVFDKDIYTETDEIITINLKTSETNHETKMYFYDGKELNIVFDLTIILIVSFEISLETPFSTLIISA